MLRPKSNFAGKLILWAIIIALAQFLADYAHADVGHTLGGYPACDTAAYFEEMVAAVASNDQAAVNYLLDVSCVMLDAGRRVTMLETDWKGVARIRVYFKDGGSIEMWTYREELGK